MSSLYQTHTHRYGFMANETRMNERDEDMDHYYGKSIIIICVAFSSSAIYIYDF